MAIRSRVFSAPSGLDSVGVKKCTQQELRNLPDEIPVMCAAKYALTISSSCCVTFQVYDVTPFMDEHPGGDEVLLAVTGESS